MSVVELEAVLSRPSRPSTRVEVQGHLFPCELLDRYVHQGPLPPARSYPYGSSERRSSLSQLAPGRARLQPPGSGPSRRPRAGLQVSPQFPRRGSSRLVRDERHGVDAPASGELADRWRRAGSPTSGSLALKIEDRSMFFGASRRFPPGVEAASRVSPPRRWQPGRRVVLHRKVRPFRAGSGPAASGAPADFRSWRT